MNARRTPRRSPHARRIAAGKRRVRDVPAASVSDTATGAPWSRWPAFVRLMRLDRPVGIWLLAAPALWALWLAAGGRPSTSNLVVFLAGSVLMRSAGCVVNDCFDRRFDGQVARTRDRPLVTGEVQAREALVLLALLPDTARVAASRGG